MTARELIELIQAMPKHVLDKEINIEFDDSFDLDEVREGDHTLDFVIIGDPYNDDDNDTMPGTIPGVTCSRVCDGVINEYKKEDGSVISYCPRCHWHNKEDEEVPA